MPQMGRFRMHFGMNEKINERINIPVRQLRWKLLARSVKLLMNSQWRAPHVPRKMHTRETNARDVICTNALTENRRFRKNQQFAQQKKMKERERESMRNERNQKRKERKKKTFVSPRVGSQSLMRRRCPSRRTVDPLSTGGFMENDALRKLRTRHRR